MQAEVIAIGDELTSGQRLDTNSQWISQRLGEMGIRVLFHTTVADDIESNVRAFQQAVDRVDLIICTGGLGPTADDLTRQAIAAATNRSLELDEAALAHIESMFTRRKREMPERNRSQAMFPAGSQIVPNPHGTAPGIDLQVKNEKGTTARIFALPGVPAEMKEMWDETVVPRLAAESGVRQQVICHRRFKCFGVGESGLEEMLPDLIRRGRVPTVGITVHRATITLRITAAGDDESTALASMEPTIQTIHDSLGDLVFGEEDDELHDVIVRQLATQGKSVAIAEWGTAGLVAQWIGDVPQAPLAGAVVIGNGAALDRVLDSAKIDPKTYQRDSTHALANHVRDLFQSDYGLAISQFPTQEALESGTPQFHVGLATADNVIVKSRNYGGHPDIIKERSAKQALDVLRKELMNQR